jgi:hypothetical protein
MVDTLLGLPGSEPETDSGTWINGQLSGIHITPSLTDHDGADLHIHWTPTSATLRRSGHRRLPDGARAGGV